MEGVQQKKGSRMGPLYLILTASVWLLCNTGEACKTQSEETKFVRIAAEVAEPHGENGKDDDDDDCVDETEDDVAKDEEDFDLICEHHVSPNRTKRLPDVVIIGARKGGTRALIEFLKLHPMLKSAGPEIHFFDKHYHKGPDW